MTEAKIDRRQVEGYRNMWGEERLQIAFELTRMVCDIARAGIVAQYPHPTSNEIEAELRRRIEYGRMRTSPARR